MSPGNLNECSNKLTLRNVAYILDMYSKIKDDVRRLKMIVRALRENELPALLHLYTLLHPEDPMFDPESSQASELWQKMSSDPYIRYYAAEIDGNIVSTCTLAIISNLTRNAQPYGLIENVFTDEGFRKKGIATAVLRCALAEAWAAGCYKVVLFTGGEKEETLRFYEQAGFRRSRETGFIACPEQKEPLP
jgi:GNAT superfamily N-acetyltransferase